MEMEGKRKILVIDDEEKNVKLVDAQLSSSGYEVVTATNGSEGIKKARKEKPDLILLDVMMPEMSGEDVARELLDDPETKNIPIVFLTAIIDRKEGGVDLLKDIGGQHFIAKPIEKIELLSVIKYVLEGKDKK